MKFSWNDTSAGSSKKRKRIQPVIALAVALAVLMLIWISVPSQPKFIQSLGDSWVLKDNQTGPVIGDLGGVPVSIPKPYAHFVEYDGDPHFMEQRKGAPPERTYHSRLRSFGFEIRYPDMAALTEETGEQKNWKTSTRRLG